jgi:ferredoxin-type protein NapH
VRKYKISKMRYVMMTIGIIAITAAGVGGLGLGTYCSVCPVGFLEISAASRSFPIDMIPGVAISLLAVLILGRFFCGWLCSTTLITHLFGNSEKAHNTRSQPDRLMRKIPLVTLILIVGLSFLVRFPVFCLVCPIGLFFGFMFAIFRTVYTLDPSWNLIIFPGIIAAELLIFRKWCTYICPISAMFSLVSKVPFFKLRPISNGFSCFSSTHGHCSKCREICPEGIDVINDEKATIEQCTSCMECADNCPTGSIQYRIVKRDKA